MSKELVYHTDVTINKLFIGLEHRDFIISLRIYKHKRKLFNWELKPSFSYTINVPYIRNPFYDGEYGTNKILKTKEVMLRQVAIDKIEEFKRQEENETII